MGLESLDCTLYGIATVHIGGHHLVLCVTFLLDGLTILCAGLVVQYLEVNFVAALFDFPTDVVVGRKTGAVVLGSEGLN